MTITLGSCNYMKPNDEKCGTHYNLNSLLFRYQDDRSSSFELDLCEYHFKEFKDGIHEQIDKLENREMPKIMRKIQNERLICKENDVHYNPEFNQKKFDSIKKSRDLMKFQQCMNNFCKYDLGELRSPVYSIVVFSRNGKVLFKWYFCSDKCITKMKARCGIDILPKEKVVTVPLDRFT